jgi:transcriptional regulator with XRE-family HTH domain
MTSLRAARLSRHWTLRRLVEEVDATAGRTTGLTESLISQWERGNVRPSLRYRGMLAEVFSPEEIDFDANEVDSSRELTLLVTHTEVTAAMGRIVRDARTFLAMTGSRSREPEYMETVERVLSAQPGLVHYRVLFGPPRNQIFKDHLHRLLEVCDPRDRSVSGVQRLHIGLAPAAYQENCLCTNEREAVVVQPSLVSPGNFDTAVLFSQASHARAMVSYVQQLYQVSEKLETRAAVEQLVIEEPPLECL